MISTGKTSEVIFVHLRKDEFSLRQTMVRPDFECYHYLDQVAPEVDFHEHEFYEVFFFLSEMFHIISKDVHISSGPGYPPYRQQGYSQTEVTPGKPYERYVVWITPEFLQEQKIRSKSDGLF